MSAQKLLGYYAVGLWETATEASGHAGRFVINEATSGTALDAIGRLWSQALRAQWFQAPVRNSVPEHVQPTPGQMRVTVDMLQMNGRCAHC